MGTKNDPGEARCRICESEQSHFHSAGGSQPGGQPPTVGGMTGRTAIDELTLIEEIAHELHDAYERQAASFGYTTRPETRVWNSSSVHGNLMMAVVATTVMPRIATRPVPPNQTAPSPEQSGDRDRTPPQDERLATGLPASGAAPDTEGQPRQDEASLPLREQLAALCHEQWSGWMRYLYEKLSTAGLDQFYNGPRRVIETPQYERWLRLMGMPYADLAENEKESDRKEADRILAVIQRGDEASLPFSTTKTRYDNQKRSGCRTPNSMYRSVISDRTVAIRVLLPFAPKLTKDEAVALETRLECAVENVLAGLFEPIGDAIAELEAHLRDERREWEKSREHFNFVIGKKLQQIEELERKIMRRDEEIAKLRTQIAAPAPSPVVEARLGGFVGGGSDAKTGRGV